MGIFFIADTHFCHANIIKYCNRPFSSVSEMDETIIRNWNLAVGLSDTVYHLGDFGFVNLNRLNEIAKELNGIIHLIRGNHDHDNKLHALTWRFKEIVDRAVIKVPDVDTQSGQRVIVLDHYALRVWDRKHYGSWHFAGHSHGACKEILPQSIEGGLCCDVGVDVWGFRPIGYEEIRQIMLQKQSKIAALRISDISPGLVL